MRLYVALAPRSDLLRTTRVCLATPVSRSTWTSSSRPRPHRTVQKRLIMAIDSKTNVRELMGHSHSHAHGHSHDTTLLTGNKNDAGVRITRIGLYVNIGMAVSKGLGGYMFNSKAYVVLGVRQKRMCHD